MNFYAFYKHLPFVLASLLFVVACGKNDKKPLDIPANYDAATYQANTLTQYDVRTRFANFITEAKKGRTAGTVVAANALTDLYTTGTPNLQSITSTYYNNKVISAAGWITTLANASGNTYTPGIPTGQGGNFGGYLFDANGLEMEQMLDKGLFGAALYNHAITLMEGEMTTAKVDQLVAIFGAHPDFPNTPTAANAANPDAFMANYAARRDKNDGNGLYSQTKKAFIELQAAVKAGSEYNEERDAALATIRLNWEKINFATVINYCHSVISTMSSTAPTDSQKASALHAYGECVGFAHGWRTLSSSYRLITDPEIDAILVLLNAPYDGTPTSYKFITDPVTELPKLTQIIETIQEKYGFTSAEVVDFKENWVAKQGR